jgi:hypothetical protein
MSSRCKAFFSLTIYLPFAAFTGWSSELDRCVQHYDFQFKTRCAYIKMSNIWDFLFPCYYVVLWFFKTALRVRSNGQYICFFIFFPHSRRWNKLMSVCAPIYVLLFNLILQQSSYPCSSLFAAYCTKESSPSFREVSLLLPVRLTSGILWHFVHTDHEI